ncbi:glycoside hydrolase family 35 protein [Aspergillus undulatus]|uniref:glycoside hydrolase family 35 protein n=1 Tax=Aspergillus undulatus TaxID=1810928 RepID=UPI003CCC9385
MLLFRFILLLFSFQYPWPSSALDIVTWDGYSVLVHGERILLLSGEFHPFRLPSPGLWLDVFQKIRAIGYGVVSFYLDWALLEGERGHIRMRKDGVFALDQFFDAAKEAGIYLIARPGPYINSEVSGGGFPGWLARLRGRLRTEDPDYLAAITPYLLTVGRIIAKAQIVNGGPVILFQPENEYTLCMQSQGYTQVNNMSFANLNSNCLQKGAGIVVPFVINDALPFGNFAPGSGVGAGDIYSFDNYPARWDGSPDDPTDWSEMVNPLLQYNYTIHMRISPDTPMSISEFQGGVPDPWGGGGVERSAAFINAEFGIAQVTPQMFGGTNWGNLGHPGGYTSYDIGAAISENRGVHREKYSEIKLQSSFLRASPLYMTSEPDNGTFGVYTDTNDILTTRLSTPSTEFYIVRHSDLTSLESTPYKLQVQTSIGKLNIPQLGGSLTLSGRDSKFHVTDYDVGGLSLLYSTAEIFSWQRTRDKTVLLLYGGEGEDHEFAVPAHVGMPLNAQSNGVVVKKVGGAIVVKWQVEPLERIVKFRNGMQVSLLWRNEAYKHWVLDLPDSGRAGDRYLAPFGVKDYVIVKAGYLLRTAEARDRTLYLTGDFNTTTDVEVISSSKPVSSLAVNGKRLPTVRRDGRLAARVHYEPPDIFLPELQDWRYIDSLPEIKPSYDDRRWTWCNLRTSNNPRNLSTPTSLYASDYGYNAGSLIYRGTFIATGDESAIYLLTEGGYAYGTSVWLDDVYLGSWEGSATDMFHNQTLEFPTDLDSGVKYTLTMLIDHMGLDLNFPANIQTMKDPRGILDYELKGRDKSSVTWKLTGNLGGEKYWDHSRGPLNEGALYAERQGYHLPNAPTTEWEQRSPFEEIKGPGVGFYVTTFNLDIPQGYDIPISLVFSETVQGNESAPAKFRAQIYVNGWQFGKYINHIGPQSRYPVPEGILDYNGTNTLALSVWSQEPGTLSLGALKLSADAVLESGYSKPPLVKGATYTRRRGSY